MWYKQLQNAQGLSVTSALKYTLGTSQKNVKLRLDSSKA